MIAVTISVETTVNEAIRQCPQALTLFKGAGIDACCGGILTIEEAATRHGVDSGDLVRRIRALMRKAPI